MTGLALRVSVPKWNVESELGYKPITTFWEDFSIADKFGNEAVNDTFKRKRLRVYTLPFIVKVLTFAP